MIDFLIGLGVLIVSSVLVLALIVGAIWALMFINPIYITPIMIGSFMLFWIWHERKIIYRSLSELGREVRGK